MIQDELTEEDKKRMARCDHYKLANSILESIEEYKDMNVGEVYMVHRVYKSGSKKPISRTYGGQPDKFMIFHKDENNFVFAKRITANGSLGKEIICMTTQFLSNMYEVTPDPEYVDAIILSNEDNYDPLKAQKDINSKKGKARRRNKKLEIEAKTFEDAYAKIKELKVGDIIYDADTAYGYGTIEWKVIEVDVRPVNKSPTKWMSHRLGNTYEDQQHNDYKFPEVVEVKIEAQHELPKCRKYVDSKRSLIFRDFYWGTFYHSRPYSIEDFNDQ